MLKLKQSKWTGEKKNRSCSELGATASVRTTFKMADKPSKPSMNWEAIDLPKEWRRFKQHCEFTFKGPLAAKSEVEKVNYLMTYIGDRGRELYTTFVWAPAQDDTPAENDTLAGVYRKYEVHVAPQSNEIRATVNFSRRLQGPKERFDDFVMALRVLIKDCGFAEEERMLRDAIVLRSHSATVREKCLDKGNELTLEKAIQIGQNHEASQESMRVIDARVDEDPKVHTVQTKSRNHRGRQGKPAAAEAARKTAQANCGRCGYSNSHESCPAYNSTCGYCRKRGHWSKMCGNKAKRGHKQPKATHAVEEMAENDQDDDQCDSQYQDMHLVSTVTEAKGHISEWWEKVELEGHSLQCQIDTGAAQSLLPYRDYVKI